MSTGYKLHRIARRIGDAEAIAEGRFGKRLVRRSLFLIAFGIIGGIIRKATR